MLLQGRASDFDDASRGNSKQQCRRHSLCVLVGDYQLTALEVLSLDPSHGVFGLGSSYDATQPSRLQSTKLKHGVEEMP